MKKAMTASQAKSFLKDLNGWHLSANTKSIYREFMTKNFMAAIDLLNGIAEIAQEENHHPDIYLTDYRKLRVELTTDDAGGLSDLDFIEASKINDLVGQHAIIS